LVLNNKEFLKILRAKKKKNSKFLKILEQTSNFFNEFGIEKKRILKKIGLEKIMIFENFGTKKK
jgi:hypothetical protein